MWIEFELLNDNDELKRGVYNTSNVISFFQCDESIHISEMSDEGWRIWFGSTDEATLVFRGFTMALAGHSVHIANIGYIRPLTANIENSAKITYLRSITGTAPC